MIYSASLKENIIPLPAALAIVESYLYIYDPIDREVKERRCGGFAQAENREIIETSCSNYS
jgi:hypothetical protein